MSRSTCSVVIILLAVGLSSYAASSCQAGFLIGSTFHVTATNSPNSIDEDIVLTPGTTLIDGGLVALTQTIVEQGGGTWLNLSFQSTQGKLISNISAYGAFAVTGVQLESAALYTARMVYWTIGGEPVQPLRAFDQFTPVAPNPIDLLGRPAYVHRDAVPQLLTVLGQALTLQPASVLSNGGINPNLVDGIVMAFQITTAVPEPEAYKAALTGGIILAIVGLGRSRKAAFRPSRANLKSGVGHPTDA